MNCSLSIYSGSSCIPKESHPYLPDRSNDKHVTDTNNGNTDENMKTNTTTNISRPETRLSDPRNADILVWIGDRLLPRELAKVSVFDSSVQGGDAVWEGLRIYNSKIFKLDEHLSRLMDSAKAMEYF